MKKDVQALPHSKIKPHPERLVRQRKLILEWYRMACLDKSRTMKSREKNYLAARLHTWFGHESNDKRLELIREFNDRLLKDADDAFFRQAMMCDMGTRFLAGDSFAARCSRLLADETEWWAIQGFSLYFRKYFPDRFEVEAVPKIEKLAIKGGSEDAVSAFGMLTYDCPPERRKRLIKEAPRLIIAEKDGSWKRRYLRSWVNLMKNGAREEPATILKELLKIVPAAQDRELATGILSATRDAGRRLRSLSLPKLEQDLGISTLLAITALYREHEDVLVAHRAKGIEKEFK